MRIIDPSFEIINRPNGHEVLRHLELCGRVCYKSEDAISDESAEPDRAFQRERSHNLRPRSFSRVGSAQDCQFFSGKHSILQLSKIKIRQRADIYPSLFRRRGFKAL